MGHRPAKGHHFLLATEVAERAAERLVIRYCLAALQVGGHVPPDTQGEYGPQGRVSRLDTATGDRQQDVLALPTHGSALALGREGCRLATRSGQLDADRAKVRVIVHVRALYPWAKSHPNRDSSWGHCALRNPGAWPICDAHGHGGSRGPQPYSIATPWLKW